MKKNIKPDTPVRPSPVAYYLYPNLFGVTGDCALTKYGRKTGRRKIQLNGPNANDSAYCLKYKNLCSIPIFINDGAEVSTYQLRRYLIKNTKKLTATRSK